MKKTKPVDFIEVPRTVVRTHVTLDSDVLKYIEKTAKRVGMHRDQILGHLLLGWLIETKLNDYEKRHKNPSRRRA